MKNIDKLKLKNEKEIATILSRISAGWKPGLFECDDNYMLWLDWLRTDYEEEEEEYDREHDL